jgi:5'-nucleotidase
VGEVGGAAVLASYFNADRAQNPHTLLLSGGDTFGASPPIANVFEEIPAVEALNALGLRASAVGNHEFDRGLDHFSAQIDRAHYPYLSANLKNEQDNLHCRSRAQGPCIAPYQIVELGGVKVALIGLTTPETPSLLSPGTLGTLEFEEPVAAAQRARSEAASRGAEVFVILAHIGASMSPQPAGPLIDLAKQVSGFDLIVGGHTHTQINTEVNGVAVVETKNQGVEYFKINLCYDGAQGQVTSHEVIHVIPKAKDVTPDPALQALLDPYQQRLYALFDSPLATSSALLPQGNNVTRLGEAAIGNLITDALSERYGADIALFNGGSIRDALPSSYAPADHQLRRPSAGYRPGPPFDLVRGDVYAMLPFGGNAVTAEITGEQLWQALEHSVSFLPVAKGGFAQVSGIRFTFDSSKPPRARLVSVQKNDGTPIVQDQKRYSLVASEYLLQGGDGYTMLTALKAQIREPLNDIVSESIKARAALQPLVEGRIQDVAAPPPPAPRP